MIDDHLLDEMKVRVKVEAKEIVMKFQASMLGDRADLGIALGGTMEQPVLPEGPVGGIEDANGNGME